MINAKLLFLLLILSSPLYFNAQDKTPAKFGNVKANDFESKIYSIDSNANAVVIAEVGSTEIVGNRKGWFSYEFKHFKRIHILNKNGFDAADYAISLYVGDKDDEENLQKLKASTYNLVNGKVVETKLNTKSQVLKDKVNKNWVQHKFTFPNVQEGSIIEFEYTIVSDFLQNLRSWEFQGGLPRIWSEYNLSVPNFLGYVFLSRGNTDYDIKTRKDSRQRFAVSQIGEAARTERIELDEMVVDHRWVKKNVPALKEESYTTSLANHISKLEFQLSDLRPPLTSRRIMGDWNSLSYELLNADYFGEEIKKDRAWARDIVNPLIKDITDPLEKANAVYTYVQSNYTCTNFSRVTIDGKLRDVAKKKSGTVAEINLLLAALLHSAGIKVDPVILSTRSNGYTYELYPLMSQYDYVIVRADIKGNSVYMDASESALVMGKLPLRCYNGAARGIAEPSYLVQLPSDLVEEKSFINIMLLTDEEGKMVGRVDERLGYYQSFKYKDDLRKSGKESFISELEKNFSEDIKVIDFQVDSTLTKADPLKYTFQFKKDAFEDDIVYITPMFNERYKENPFKSVKRLYPVEMPYKLEQSYVMSFTIPENYTIDEMPKSMTMRLNEEGDAIFEYRLSQSGGIISFRCRLIFNKSYFPVEQYSQLRDFFDNVVKKQAEQIVLKKKA